MMINTSRVDRAITQFFEHNFSAYTVADVVMRKYVDIMNKTDTTNASELVLPNVTRYDMCRIGAFWHHPNILALVAFTFTSSMVPMVLKQLNVSEDSALYKAIMDHYTQAEFITQVGVAIQHMSVLNKLPQDVDMRCADVCFRASLYPNIDAVLLA